MYDGTASPVGERKSFFPSHEVERSRARRMVFLHGMWRSGSTYLWSRFRGARGTCCFYEPLHHGLGKLTRARIERDTPEKIDANRHPTLAQPYFAEFAPLIDRRGVFGYHRSLAYDRFILSPGEAHPRLERYVTGLISHAESRGATPVLGFNRTGLRLAWLKARFDAFHIHIDREPAAIWASYAAEAAKGNPAFFAMWLTVLEKNAGHPLMAPLADRLNLHRPLPVSLSAKARHRHIIETMTQEESYFLVYYLWLACTSHALAESDLLIDTRLADEPHYAAGLSDRIARATGLSVDLSRMRAAEPRTLLAKGTQARIEHSAAALFPRAALPKTPIFRPRVAALSPLNGDRLAAAF
jgi:hypothetical protein